MLVLSMLKWNLHAPVEKNIYCRDALNSWIRENTIIRVGLSDIDIKKTKKIILQIIMQRLWGQNDGPAARIQVILCWGWNEFSFLLEGGRGRHDR